MSCAKLLYYFADWWLGHLILVLPAKWRGAVIVFDRDFSDLVVDQRRYLVRGVGTLAQLLRRLAPRADVTFVLDADPHTVHARKPELPVTELQQLRQSYRRFAEADRRTHLVPADDNADLVALRATRTVLLALASREQCRRLSRTKRLFDVAAATVALAVLSPLLVLLGLLVRAMVGSPILFKQDRPGFQGRPFTILKFRTMTNARNSAGRLLPDAERLTPFGRFLRSTSLDELPELFNVLRGDMSLVGPRPLLMEYLPRYSAEQMRRHDVFPGITGWAQINGRNAISWARRFELDLRRSITGRCGWTSGSSSLHWAR